MPEYVKNGKVKMPSDDTNIDYYRWAQFILAEKGFDKAIGMDFESLTKHSLHFKLR